MEKGHTTSRNQVVNNPDVGSSLTLEAVGNNDWFVSDKFRSIAMIHTRAYRAPVIHQDEQDTNILHKSRWKVVQLESSVA